MSYVVLARKWRPMRFEDLVGQEHVARTLANAIESGRVAHAFLFTGVRGVGKTTSARILAKALNCMGKPGTVPPGEDPGPTVSPCLECPACREIAAGTDVDVREIDGASYNGVDEVRKLQDSLPYRPSRDRSKIFIVDEVHMLSQSAWNAFLKTLEEPPPHVKFIFATTEVHKVPITILSRVQRFDFKLIPTLLIADRLRQVLAAEGIVHDDAALSLIAREAAGSMRDAMSLLDQVIAWGGDKLSGDDVARVLGVASHQVLHDLARALLAGDAARCLNVVSDLAIQGFDMPHVTRDFLALLRDLVVAKVCPDSRNLLDLPDEEQRDVLAVAQNTDADDLLRLHQGFSQAFDEVIESAMPRAALEMLLVRLARRPALLPIDDLIGRLNSLERRASGRAQKSQSPVPDRGTRPADSPPRREGREAGARREAGPGKAGDRHDEPPPEASTTASLPLRAAPPPAAPAIPPFPEPDPVAPPPNREPTGKPASTRSPAVAQDAFVPPPFPEPSAPAQKANGNGHSSPPASVRPSPAQAPETPEARQAFERWRGVLEHIRGARPELAAFLEHAAVLRSEPDALALGFEPGSLFAKEATSGEAREALARVCRERLGQEVVIDFELESTSARGAYTVFEHEKREREKRTQAAIEQARQHPRINDAIEILGARIKDLRLPDSG